MFVNIICARQVWPAYILFILLIPTNVYALDSDITKSFRFDGIYKSSTFANGWVRYYKFSESGEFWWVGTNRETDYGAYLSFGRKNHTVRGLVERSNCSAATDPCFNLVPSSGTKKYRLLCPIALIPCSKSSDYKSPVSHEIRVKPGGALVTEGLTLTFIGIPEKTAISQKEQNSITTDIATRAKPRESGVQCELRKAQAVLSDLGFNPGPVDGQWGRKTSNAILKYQQQNELKVTGRLDESVCNSLGLPIPTVVTVAVQEEWGIVSPKNCYWECERSTGCKYEADPLTEAKPEDKEEHDYWMNQGVGGLHPLLGAVKIDGVYYQPIMLSGTSTPSVSMEGSRWISDPHGIHLGQGWKQTCSADVVKTIKETKSKPRIQSY